MNSHERGQETPLVSFEGITKVFDGTIALADVTFSVLPGQFIVLLGPSGSGKSTLLRCVAGIERITAGKISLAGTIVDNGRTQAPPERRDLAMVFQDYALWPHMTARENVRFALRRRKLSARVADQQARTMLANVGLKDLTERYPSELSGGQQQRVALARALVASPRLLLFDEPLSNLDASLRERMRIEIATLVRAAGATALYITHDQAEAFALADRIGVLENGRLVQFGTPEMIYRAPTTPFVARLTGLSGEVPGRVVRSDATDEPHIAIGETVITAHMYIALPPETPVRLLVRPAAVHLLSPMSDAAQIRCVVRDVAFCGRGYEHVVEMPDGHRLTGVFTEARWERGEHVGIRLDTEGCLVFPDGAEGGSVSTPLPPSPAHMLPV